MALVMVQGHLCDMLLSPTARGHTLYQLQALFHGSTAPGFLFASGFVAGLPRLPLSLRASLRRARRLLFILGVGYALHLPYFSLWKTLVASRQEKAVFLACNALHVIAVSQLFVLVLQWALGRRWIQAAGACAVIFLATGPAVWASDIPARLPLILGTYLDGRFGSFFPVFPYSAFVLAGIVAGAALGRQEEVTRKRRALLWGSGLMATGAILSWLLAGHVDFWGVSPAYALLRLGGLLLLLHGVERLADRPLPGTRALALLGHETLLVYVLHLYLLFGGVLGPAPLGLLAGHMGFALTFTVLALIIPLLLAAAFLWNRTKARAPRESSLALVFLGTWFLYEFLTRPW